MLKQSGSRQTALASLYGGQDFARNPDLLRTNGRLVVIATLSGTHAAVDLRQLMGKRLTLTDSTLRSCPLAERIALKDSFLVRVAEALSARRLKPVMDGAVSITDAEQAHDRMQKNLNIGKLVLNVS